MRSATERLVFAGTAEQNWEFFSNIVRVQTALPEVKLVSNFDGINYTRVGQEFTVDTHTGEKRVYVLEAVDNLERRISWSLVATSAQPAETDGLRYSVRLTPVSSVTSNDSTLVEWQVAMSHNANEDYFRFVTANLFTQLQEVRANVGISLSQGRAQLRTSQDGDGDGDGAESEATAKRKSPERAEKSKV